MQRRNFLKLAIASVVSVVLGNGTKVEPVDNGGYVVPEIYKSQLLDLLAKDKMIMRRQRIGYEHSYLNPDNRTQEMRGEYAYWDGSSWTKPRYSGGSFQLCKHGDRIRKV